MATSPEFIEMLGEQLASSGASARKMFGEYGVYLDGKIFALVCDNRFLVKPTPSARRMLPDASEEAPYAGAKPMLLVENLDDAAFLCELARRIADELPAPKPKKPRKQRE